MSLKERKRQAEALIRSSWCNIDDFHDWIQRSKWTCTLCADTGLPCTFSDKATTHCDYCSPTRCSAKVDFRRAFFMHKFGISEEIYESWTKEWRIKMRQGAVPTGSCPKDASPVPTRSDQGAIVVANKPKPTNASIKSHIVSSTTSTPKQLASKATVKPAQVRNGNGVPKTNEVTPLPQTASAAIKTTSSLRQYLDKSAQFFQAIHTLSEQHLKESTEQKTEQERAQVKEDKMKERIRVLELKLKESQESRERVQATEHVMQERTRLLEQMLKESQESRESAQAKEDEMKGRICVLEQELKESQESGQAKEHEINERTRVLEQELRQSLESGQAKEDEMTQRICVLERSLKESQALQERVQATECEMKERTRVLEQELEASRESGRAKEEEMTQRICMLERKLKESQGSRISLKSRLEAIVQDLQMEVTGDDEDNPNKRKREESDDGELLYPSQRPLMQGTQMFPPSYGYGASV
ncbi:hypothetical protein ONZ45_g11016 [Pleurotus djamor]|nr:hypothetical protein ONZ45_g11016 [Pleurotus djamor]